MPLGEWDLMETIIQDRDENILLFIARNELAYVIRVQEDGFVMGGDPEERVGYEHGVIDDWTCAYKTEL